MDITEVTWIGAAANGMIIARWRGADGQVEVDRPAARSFAQPESLVLRDGRPVVDGVVLQPVAAIPADFASVCGWYAGGGRELLVTQVPEPDFGEPMVLLSEGGRIVRAYPLDALHLLAEDGARVDLVVGGLRVHEGPTVTALTPSRRVAEREVSFVAAGTRLAGTVVVPAGDGPHPAAVLVHGAAGGQRDFNRLFAGPLLDAGVAVLIYDKAGHGTSTGDGDPSIFDQAEAASAALDLLASLPEVDASRIGLAGFSNGMWSVPIVAAERADVAFVTGIGAPGVSMAESEVHRRTKVLREAGVGPATNSVIAEAWRSVFRIVAAGTADDDVAARLDQALTEIAAAPDLDRYVVPDLVRENPMLSPIPPFTDAKQLVEMLGGDADPQVVHDPAADYARVACPVFLQYGSDDTSVPVEASARAVERVAPGATIRVYAGLEHMLEVLPTDTTGLTLEAAITGFHHFSFGTGPAAELTSWLRETLRRTPRS
ncbi:pimeloyl-ACP methyl ester carboxylesterase [Allocatelliglobosispora scoriae]|uniref:Pimeloyl-ACP methyl ester carboxylesterase n=1 Tax=Allocatelliglobosispora scoriae TaxID=643052 RepID=A0A841BIC1_9ACTN|nr:alpha/beta hydrolase [Allocatelliglobosispora scoriae]MBB5868867.1 pimeloyl-ACP methyl ester carboxylesterase [Allocatelliglobosispora scoriae]